MFKAVVVALAVATACSASNAAPSFPSWVTENMDLTADPCSDFYQYSCGGWMKKNPLPPSLPVVDKSITTIETHNNKVISDVLHSTQDPKLQPFFANCVDRGTINALGLKSLTPYRVVNLTSLDDVAGAAGRLTGMGLTPFWVLDVVADPTNPALNIAEIDQGGFTLPSRAMYNDTSIAAAYTSHITDMYKLTGMSASDAAAAASAIVKFETALASASMPPAAIRDPHAVYNPTNLLGLMGLAPGFPFGIWLEAAGVNSIGTKLNVAEPTVVTAVDAAINATAVADLQAYLDWLVLHSAASQALLPDAFVNATFDFFGKVVNGESEAPSTDAACVSLTDTYFSDLVSKAFVAASFSADAKDEATTLITSIQNKFLNNLQQLSWMDPVTQKAAVLKQQEMIHHIGYPSVWKAYSGFDVTPGRHLDTVMKFMNIAFADSVTSLIGTPTNRSSWIMAADIVNAEYDPLTNSISVTAGILQAPYFNDSANLALNFAGVGVIAGHENSHGFDDQGRLYDGHGYLRNWWTNATAAEFEKRVQCIIDQYGDFEILPGVHVNGELTQGENVADNGGVKMAMHAYLDELPPSPSNSSAVALFSVVYAQGWCSVASDEYLKLQVETDPHSPAKFRAIGPLMNRPEFSEAFQCPAGSVMNPATKCEVW